ncbi:hypothetical protein DFH08DRAFT_809976 [Mycena albidolilacea]|uniref:Uncharacterized protein n=1 Tax=Mycena albidolilacea TaxID=1033008 RepID=A0AAD7ERI9_9AGAR|nr:hypothetical protein DFH08DRAFT_809976 [Mycena albidolilacea]
MDVEIEFDGKTCYHVVTTFDAISYSECDNAVEEVLRAGNVVNHGAAHGVFIFAFKRGEIATTGVKVNRAADECDTVVTKQSQKPVSAWSRVCFIKRQLGRVARVGLVASDDRHALRRKSKGCAGLQRKGEREKRKLDVGMKGGRHVRHVRRVRRLCAEASLGLSEHKTINTNEIQNPVQHILCQNPIKAGILAKEVSSGSMEDKEDGGALNSNNQDLLEKWRGRRRSVSEPMPERRKGQTANIHAQQLEPQALRETWSLDH